MTCTTPQTRFCEDLPIRNWSFMVLNVTNGAGELDNLENCRRMQEDMTRQHIEVVDGIIVDCIHRKKRAIWCSTAY